jgi:hypothetical protein
MKSARLVRRKCVTCDKYILRILETDLVISDFRNYSNPILNTAILLHNVQDYCIPVRDPLSQNTAIYMSLFQLSYTIHCPTVFTLIR